MKPGYREALLVFCLATKALCAQPTPIFEFRLAQAYGTYPVGVKVVSQYDRSRIFNGPSAQHIRPLQTLIWYPAEKPAAPNMTIGDYAALVKTETSFDKAVEDGKPQSFVRDFTQGTPSVSTSAVRNASERPGLFPFIIYAPSSNAPAFENIELCEFLASHGFVVLATPSMGAATRAMTVDVAGANAEAQDISFLIDFARSLPNVNTGSTGVIGYSWGGMSALFAAARDKRIGALVSLDGSFRYGPATVRQAGDVHPDSMTIPLMVFSRAEETLEVWDATTQMKDQFSAAPNVLNQWKLGDLYHLHMLAMSHIQFSSLFQRSERFRKEGRQFAPADYSLEEGAVSYSWMARYTLEFLKAYLQHNAEATAFLKNTPSENGVPHHLIASTFRPASAKPPVMETRPAP